MHPLLLIQKLNSAAGTAGRTAHSEKGGCKSGPIRELCFITIIQEKTPHIFPCCINTQNRSVRRLSRRCVAGEGEIEKLQAKVVELRRKLDDTTAAMQELGRENQSLQVRRGSQAG